MCRSGKDVIGNKTILSINSLWGKIYPPKCGMNLFAKGDGFAV